MNKNRWCALDPDKHGEERGVRVVGRAGSEFSHEGEIRCSFCRELRDLATPEFGLLKELRVEASYDAKIVAATFEGAEQLGVLSGAGGHNGTVA